MNSDTEIWHIDTSDKVLPKYIAVEGPIGVGKTTLTKLLAQTFNYDTLLERAEENPFLERFYANEKNAALSTQLFFLFQRAQQISQVRQNDMFHPVQVADFLIQKDHLFAEVTLDQDELKLYEQVYQHITIDAPTPDLVVYLQASTDVLLDRIEKRGISSEKNISVEYLDRLNEAYARFFHFYDQSPLLIVNAADLDWTNKPEDYRHLVEYLLTIRSGRHYYNPGSALV